MTTLHTLELSVLLWGAAGCANEALLSELRGGEPPRVDTTAELGPPPGAHPDGAADGAPCTWATQCRSGYCAENRCAHTEDEDALLACGPALAARCDN